MIVSFSLEKTTLCMKKVQFGQLEADVHMLLSSYTKVCFIVLAICGKAGNWGIIMIYY